MMRFISRFSILFVSVLDLMSLLTVFSHRPVWNVSCFNPKLHQDPNYIDDDAWLLTIRICKALFLLVLALTTIGLNSLMVLVLQVRIHAYFYFSPPV